MSHSVYQALSLEQLTLDELLRKLSEKVGVQPSEVSCVLQLTSSGLLVMVDDTVSSSNVAGSYTVGSTPTSLQVIRNFYDEDSFVVSAVKEEATSRYQLLLREHTHNTPSTSQANPPLSLAGANRTERMHLSTTIASTDHDVS